MKKKLLSALIVMTLLFAMTACNGDPVSSGNSGSTGTESGTSSTGGADTAGDALTVSVGLDASEDSVTGFAAYELKRLVEEKSGGTITVNVYPSAQLGSDREMLQSCILGDIEFVLQTTAPQTSNVAAASVFDMPGLFLNADIARSAIDDAGFRSLYDPKYTDVGLKLLMISDQGYRQTSTNVEITDMTSLQGMNIRTMENPVHVAYWQALGSNPTPMNRGEVFLALQQGLLDAQEDPFVQIYLYGYAEVQNYIVDTNHIFHTLTLITNDSWFEGLPENQKTIFNEAVEEILVTSRQKADELNGDAVQKLIDEGVTYIQLSDEMHQSFKDVGETIYPMVREAVGDDAIVDALLAAVAAAEAAA